MRKVKWITQKAANEFVAKYHRHSRPVVGSITQIGLFIDDALVGVAIIGRPVSRKVDYTSVVEVTRLATDGTPNACSQLYGAAARIAKEMGFNQIQTYILESETGVSLRASGWQRQDGVFGGTAWNGRVHHDLFGTPTLPPELKQKYVRTF